MSGRSVRERNIWDLRAYRIYILICIAALVFGIPYTRSQYIQLESRKSDSLSQVDNVVDVTLLVNIEPSKKRPLTCAHWGTHRVEVANGKAKALHRFEMDDAPSPIGTGILDVQDGPTRITQPMVRKSWLEGGPGSHNDRRGRDPFIPIP